MIGVGRKGVEAGTYSGRTNRGLWAKPLEFGKFRHSRAVRTLGSFPVGSARSEEVSRSLLTSSLFLRPVKELTPCHAGVVRVA